MKTTDQKKLEFFLCNKRKTAVKPAIKQVSCIIEKVLKSLTIKNDFEF